MKKIIVLILIVLGILILKLTSNYFVNEMLIKEYKNGTYDTKLGETLFFININERYISFYNNGNIQYKLGHYDKATEYYQKALQGHIPSKRICDVRVNLSLSLIKMATEDTIDELANEALNNLYEDECAIKGIENRDGKSEAAEDLEEEILKQGGSETSNNDNQDDNNDDNNNNTDEEDTPKPTPRPDDGEPTSGEIKIPDGPNW